MSARIVLVTNNQKFLSKVPSTEFIDGSSWDVLVRVRDMIHEGWELVSHPLYGNLRPYQQPFRSAVLTFEKPGSTRKIDEYSLNLIEHALSVYRSCSDRLLLRGVLPEATEMDYAFMDMELLKNTLTQYGLVSDQTI